MIENCPSCKIHRGHRAGCPLARVKDTPIAADLSLTAYREFLKRKCVKPTDYGFPIAGGEVNAWAKPHQRASVGWMVRGGRRALFGAFGIGKTVIQLETLRLILAILERQGQPSGRALIAAPLGVSQEFQADAARLNISLPFIRSHTEANEPGVYLTNYESVRDGKLDPGHFQAASLDEAACLRSFGGTKTFRECMRVYESVPYRFVATATPDPNQYIELLAYAAFLGIMQVSEAKTRFFKRDSTKADQLTLHPHKEAEFWLWVASWALFIQTPSDLGPAYSDEGYNLPPHEVIYHEVQVSDHAGAVAERDGQQRLYREAMHGVTDAAREKRDTLKERIECAREILDSEPEEHFLLWHDLEPERKEIERTVPGVVSVYGAQRAKNPDDLEAAIADFSAGRIQYLAAKPSMFGAGANFQYHCSRAIFCGIGFKFYAFIQALHRILRYGQTEPVKIHLIYASSEKRILDNLLQKWERHKKQVEHMSTIIRQYGLSQAALLNALARSLGVEKRTEVRGENFRIVHNDCVEEAHAEAGRMEANSVHLVLTSIPFSTQYEYSPSYNDFGHTDGNTHFFEQMDFLIPQLLRVLKPGRLAAIHVKDRIVPGGITGLGFQTVYPFHVDCIERFVRHGFAYVGMKTVVTDVVRENNQTYRLGWTEQCKDGTKMGVGMPEYLLLFRKPPSDTTNAYADEPVVKQKPLSVKSNGELVPFERNLPMQPGTGYSRSRWQIDAHGFTRSSGNRLLTPEDLEGVTHATIFKLFRKFSLSEVYDFEQHVKLGEHLETRGILPVTFMLLQPQSWSPEVWSDITRMRTLNSAQSAKGREMHLCAMQLDLVNRAIVQYTQEGETVYDPFGGLMTVPHCATLLRRKGIATELNESYFLDGAIYCRQAEDKINTPTLFDLIAVETEEAEAPAENEEREARQVWDLRQRRFAAGE